MNLCKKLLLTLLILISFSNLCYGYSEDKDNQFNPCKEMFSGDSQIGRELTAKEIQYFLDTTNPVRNILKETRHISMAFGEILNSIENPSAQGRLSKETLRVIALYRQGLPEISDYYLGVVTALTPGKLLAIKEALNEQMLVVAHLESFDRNMVSPDATIGSSKIKADRILGFNNFSKPLMEYIADLERANLLAANATIPLGFRKFLNFYIAQIKLNKPMSPNFTIYLDKVEKLKL